jgi:hypothetical protein
MQSLSELLMQNNLKEKKQVIIEFTLESMQ